MKHTVRLFAFFLFSIMLFVACKGQGASERVGTADPANPFEGVLSMKTVIPGTGATTTKIIVGEGGIRTESTASLAGLSGRVPVTVLFQASEPGRIYVLNDAARTYTFFDAPEPQADDAVDPVAGAGVERLGEEVVNGYPATHVRIAGNGSGESVELWLNGDLLDSVAWTRMQAANREAALLVARKLRSAGLEGFPVRILHHPSGVVTDLVGLERMRPDPALFRLPAHYRKADLRGIEAQRLSPEAIEGIRKAAEQLQRRLEAR
ncbi:DUF4412 domain-containing protein [Chlorobium sp. N1]|uniref:DUF4412 domain-containing protein n=1 Tax=Chlorobium sp. N1 TaxID=2491138 RepID=UPI0013F17BBC|nr:DUF4412 domain-containing protein [Chlorobium sp. N1]